MNQENRTDREARRRGPLTVEEAREKLRNLERKVRELDGAGVNIGHNPKTLSGLMERYGRPMLEMAERFSKG